MVHLKEFNYSFKNNLSNIDWEECGDSFKDIVFDILEEFLVNLKLAWLPMKMKTSN